MYDWHGPVFYPFVAAMYRIEAAVRNGWTNPSCTNTANQWVLVLYDGEHPKRNMELSALIKIYYYIYVLTKKHDECLPFSKNIK